jgi:phosphoglycerate dehydrogenase-like enzyme
MRRSSITRGDRAFYVGLDGLRPDDRDTLLQLPTNEVISAMMPDFRVGVTRDFLKPDGTIGFGDIGLSLLEQAHGVDWEFVSEDVKEITREQADSYDAMLVLSPKISASTLEGVERLALIARFGVGYDNVDLTACNRNGVLLTITPDGVRRPLATSAIAFLLALSHKLLIKDRLTREGRWHEKLDFMGMGLTGRTLGIIGLGNVGREVFRIASPLEMRHVAFDPYVGPDDSSHAGTEMVYLDTLMRDSDFVVVCCALTPQTYHLIDASCIALMKKSACLINVARGPIVDQAALTAALQEQRIQGAGLDVFELEPISPDDPLLTLENVILTPHAICWTDECFQANGRSACQSILKLAHGGVPANVVNREVLGSDQFERKRKRYQS